MGWLQKFAAKGPKFEVGDTIRNKETGQIGTIVKFYSNRYDVEFTSAPDTPFKREIKTLSIEDLQKYEKTKKESLTKEAKNDVIINIDNLEVNEQGTTPVEEVLEDTIDQSVIPKIGPEEVVTGPKFKVGDTIRDAETGQIGTITNFYNGFYDVEFETTADSTFKKEVKTMNEGEIAGFEKIAAFDWLGDVSREEREIIMHSVLRPFVEGGKVELMCPPERDTFGRPLPLSPEEWKQRREQLETTKAEIIKHVQNSRINPQSKMHIITEIQKQQYCNDLVWYISQAYLKGLGLGVLVPREYRGLPKYREDIMESDIAEMAKEQREMGETRKTSFEVGDRVTHNGSGDWTVTATKGNTCDIVLTADLLENMAFEPFTVPVSSLSPKLEYNLKVGAVIEDELYGKGRVTSLENLDYDTVSVEFENGIKEPFYPVASLASVAAKKLVLEVTKCPVDNNIVAVHASCIDPMKKEGCSFAKVVEGKVVCCFEGEINAIMKAAERSEKENIALDIEKNIEIDKEKERLAAILKEAKFEDYDDDWTKLCTSAPEKRYKSIKAGDTVIKKGSNNVGRVLYKNADDESLKVKWENGLETINWEIELEAQ
jgi:hypothetical protein